VVRDAPHPQGRAAATVAVAATLMEQARPDEALALLDEALRRDDHEPVDHAWLTGQRARACWEIGRVDDAVACAVAVQEVRSSHPTDITATAIAGTAAMLLFSASPWGAGDVKRAITGLDTMAVWWRTQRVAAGADAVIEREFGARFRRRVRVVFTGEDVANNRLATAGLLASHLADHREWGHLESLNAKQALLRTRRTSSPEEVHTSLATLRWTGDDKTMALVVRQLVADGPVAAVSAAAQEIDFEHWTRSTCAPTLSLLQHGGDVLGAATASTAVRWLLDTLADPRAFVERTRPSFDVVPRLVETLAGVVPAAQPEDQAAAAEYVLGVDAVTDELLARALARLIWALPAGVWTAERATRATDTAFEQHEALRHPLLAAAAPMDQRAHQHLLDEIREGSIRALIALNVVTDVPVEAVPTLMDKLESQINRQVEDARRHSHSWYEYDAAEILANLNVHHQSTARWETLYTLLEEPQVAFREKASTCGALARLTDKLPPAVRVRLGQIAVAALAHEDSFLDRMEEGMPSGRGAVAVLAAATGNTDVAHDQLTTLLGTEGASRLWAARLASHLDSSTAVGVLATLTQDSDPAVRAEAAGHLAAMVANGSEDPFLMTALHRCLQDQGTHVPRRIAGTLTSFPSNTTTSKLLDELATHRSASVRNMIAGQSA
jgi:hypothetical protein